MVHKNLNRPETSLTPFDLLNKNRVYYNIKRQGTTSMVIPCLCLFTVPSGASAGTCRGGAPPSCCANVFLLGRTCPRPCWERVRQTGSYSAIFFHFLILVLNVPNGATVLTCINLYTSQTAVLVDSSAHFLICGSNNSSSLNESIIS